jgi:hypothetical protein
MGARGGKEIGSRANRERRSPLRGGVAVKEFGIFYGENEAEKEDGEEKWLDGARRAAEKL